MLTECFPVLFILVIRATANMDAVTMISRKNPPPNPAARYVEGDLVSPSNETEVITVANEEGTEVTV